MDDDDTETGGRAARSGSAETGLAVLGGDAAFSLTQLLRRAGLAVRDVEAAPKQVSEALAARFHYGLASVRAGRLGEVRLLGQLVAQAFSLAVAPKSFWKQPDGTYVDALRPEVDPVGLSDLVQAEAYRRAHLEALAGLLRSAETVILPLDRLTALRDPASDMLYPRPPEGVRVPKTLKPHRASAADLDAAFGALHAGLSRPGLTLWLTVPAGPGAEDDALGLLQARASAWAGQFEGVRHDPVLDALIARAAALPADHPDTARLGALIARLLGGEDLLDIVAAGPAPAAVPEREKREKDPERRQRRKEKRAREKAQGGETAKVMCEDELLEAFSK